MPKVLYLFDRPITEEDSYVIRIRRQLSLFQDIPNLSLFIVNLLRVKKWLDAKRTQPSVDPFKPWKCISSIQSVLDVPKQFFCLFPGLYFFLYAVVIGISAKKKKIDIIYAENLVCGHIASKVKKLFKIDFVLDYHGVVPEEFQVCGKPLAFYNFSYYKKIEKRTIESAKNVICVSKKFRNYILDRFHILPDSVWVVPSCISNESIKFDRNLREGIRKRLNIENKRVLIYAGGIGHWHCTDEIVRLFKKIFSTSDQYFMLFLTHRNSVHLMEQKFESIGLDKDSFHVGSVDNQSIFEYYMAADYGIILRNNSLINDVSSPTKIPEYLSAGLVLIGTDNIGDVKDISTAKTLIEYEKLDLFDPAVLESHAFSPEERRINFTACDLFLNSAYVWNRFADVYQRCFNAELHSSIRADKNCV